VKAGGPQVAEREREMTNKQTEPARTRFPMSEHKKLVPLYHEAAVGWQKIMTDVP
jgi:hypothetical protein